MYRSRACGVVTLLMGGIVPTSPSAWGSPSTYPQRAITLVVGYAAGGATDTLARLISRSMAEDLGQNFVVENRSGASSNFGAEVVARAAPDGYTLYVGTIANAINRTLYSQLNYDFVNDFTPIGRIADVTNVLVVHDKVPVHSLQEFIAHAKAHPGKLSCASSGIGSSIHLSCELFKQQTQTDIVHVPYRGSGPAVAALLGRQVDSMFDNLPSSLPYIRAGKLRAISVTSQKTTKFAPSIPAIVQEGLPGFDVQSWFGLMAPAGTPPEIVSRLNASLNRVLADPAIQRSYVERGFSLPSGDNSPETFSRFVTAEIDKWGAVVRSTELKAN